MCPVTHERRCHHVSGTFRLCLPHAVPSHVAAALILVPLLCAHRSSGSSAECLSRFAWPLTIKAVPSRFKARAGRRGHADRWLWSRFLQWQTGLHSWCWILDDGVGSSLLRPEPARPKSVAFNILFRGTPLPGPTAALHPVTGHALAMSAQLRRWLLLFFPHQLRLTMLPTSSRIYPLPLPFRTELEVQDSLHMSIQYFNMIYRHCNNAKVWGSLSVCVCVCVYACMHGCMHACITVCTHVWT